MQLGIVAHEIGHAIGFHHEQSRPDRDDYIRVHYENIQSGLEYNFEKYSWDEVTTRDVQYDIGSVMHYSSHVSPLSIASRSFRNHVKIHNQNESREDCRSYSCIDLCRST